MGSASVLFTPTADPRQYTLGPVYVPGEIDGHGEAITDAELEALAWRFLARHGEIGVAHIVGDATITGHCTLVESYIYRGPDWQVTGPDGTEQIITAGTWMLAGIWDAAGWALVRSGKIRGWSMQGSAARRSPTAAERSQLSKGTAAMRRARLSKENAS